MDAAVICSHHTIRFPYAAHFERSASCLEVGMTGPVILGRAGRTPLPCMPLSQSSGFRSPFELCLIHLCTGRRPICTFALTLLRLHPPGFCPLISP
jgi:hypothetical protein